MPPPTLNSEEPVKGQNVLVLWRVFGLLVRENQH